MILILLSYVLNDSFKISKKFGSKLLGLIEPASYILAPPQFQLSQIYDKGRDCSGETTF